MRTRPGCSEEHCPGHIRQEYLDDVCPGASSYPVGRGQAPVGDPSLRHDFKRQPCRCLSCPPYGCTRCCAEVDLEFCYDDDTDVG